MPTQEQLDIINEHLPYEIDMLRGTWRRLQHICSIRVPANETLDEKIERFSLIESFCVHARSLTDFFDIRGKVKSDDAVSSDFTNTPTASLDATQKDQKALREKLNKQIFHLTTRRETVETKKFDAGSDGVELLQMIEPEIAKFQSNLTTDFSSFKCNSQPVQFVASLPFSTSTATVRTSVHVVFGPTQAAKPV
jgi:hypothetical protein